MRKSFPLFVCLAFLAAGGVLSSRVAASAPAAGADAGASGAKKLMIPHRVSRVPEGNDYSDNDSEFSFARRVEGENVAIFWHKEYGDNPLENPNQRRRFDVKKMLSECERFYDYYVQELEVVKQGSSISDQHKLLVYVFGGDEGVAYGGGIDDNVAALWTPASRVNREPYGVLAHEMGHSFQFLSRVDSGVSANGAISEMSAQYMLWQVYPDWMTFENYHLVDFMKKTHFAFLHPTNMYHSPYVLEYWSDKHGKTFYGELNRATRPGEDVVATYRRMHGLDQRQFNDEMFDACRRFITWDLKRVEHVARPYANQHQCKLAEAEEGWLRITPERCPQNYGYNGIRLDVPAAGSEVKLEFQGLPAADGFRAVKPEKAGWRYGFVAHLKDNARVYGDMHADAAGTATFTVPAGAEHLWLVVMGAPTEHWPVGGGRPRSRRDAPPSEQWPYQIRLSGAAVHNDFVE